MEMRGKKKAREGGVTAFPGWVLRGDAPAHFAPDAMLGEVALW